MGCINSKQAVKKSAKSSSPSFHYTVRANSTGTNGSVGLDSRPSVKNPSGLLEYGNNKGEEKKSDDRNNNNNNNNSRELRKSRKESLGGNNNSKGSFSFRLGFSHRFVEAEQVAAGWPSWLSNAAGEAVHGWVPLKADSFEKLEKIGQGTYSSVFRAREVNTNRMVALKKVRFDNFQPESIRFMAREIMVLRRLDHPNIMKLEGIITSGLSSSIYLVFEYMEHDLAGLVSCPEIEFSESQVKCYMRQLLSAMEHCHLRGIMHRDIKTSNILVNNEGILRVGDFGLANILNSRSKHPLTSRVVTLWYRPPELLMGSTSYGVSVDLWSIGCVFSELYIGKPILKGRTEVEQLHKIFKLCGSPPEEYWKKAKLPHPAMFKPQHSYESSLREKCKSFPTTAVDLMETFLSINPQDRGTASSALMSEYFRTQPYACDPSTLPRYPPNKEMDAKCREENRKKKSGTRGREHGVTQKPRRVRKLQEPKNLNRSVIKEDMLENSQFASGNSGPNAHHHLPKGKVNSMSKELLKPSYDTVSAISQMLDAPSQGDSAFTAPVQVSASNGFEWVRRLKEDASVVSYGSKSQFSALDPAFANRNFALTKQESEYLKVHTNAREHNLHETDQMAEVRKHGRKWDQRVESFDASDFLSCVVDIPEGTGRKQKTTNHPDFKDDESHIEFSGPLLLQQHRTDELLERNESRIRRASRRSRFERDK